MPISTAYDQIAYRTLPMPQTHPDRLATIALLHGMEPRPIDQCRVLELGSGDGSNLIPMAYGLPGSEFVGVDLAGTAVATGTAAISRLGLRNVTLRQLDVMDVSETLGTFDYIIAPGIYSWVPATVRDRILAVCRSHLARHGVAFVSYNTYPGCHLRQAVWQVLQFHVEGIRDPGERIGKARALARFIADCPQPDGSDGAVLRSEMRAVLDHSRGLLFHDDLAPTNVPVYFHQFVSHARQYGLQFLAEANFHETQPHAYPPEVAQQIRQLANEDVVKKEQYLDFLRNRRFRQTLLCREEVLLDRTLRREAIRSLYLGSTARPTSEQPDIVTAGTVEQFSGLRGSAMSTDYPAAKAAVFHLGRVWPRLLSFEDLLEKISRSLNGGGGIAAVVDTDALLDILLAAYAAGLVELSTHVPRFVLEAGRRPTASPVARLQLEHGAFVATLRHNNVSIEDDLGRHLLRLMDGTRSLEDLLDGMQTYVSPPATITPDELERKLAELARLGLVVE